MIQEHQIYQDRRAEQQAKVITLAMDWPSGDNRVVVENLENMNKWCITLAEFKEKYNPR